MSGAAATRRCDGGQPRQQVVELKIRTGRGALAIRPAPSSSTCQARYPEDSNLPRHRSVQTGDQVQRRRPPGTGRPHQRPEIALRNSEIEMIQQSERLANLACRRVSGLGTRPRLYSSRRILAQPWSESTVLRTSWSRESSKGGHLRESPDFSGIGRDLDFPGIGHQECGQPSQRRRVGVDLGTRRVGAAELGVDWNSTVPQPYRTSNRYASIVTYLSARRSQNSRIPRRA